MSKRKTEWMDVFIDDPEEEEKVAKIKKPNLPFNFGLESQLTDDSWSKILTEEFQKPYFLNLAKLLEEKRKSEEIFPPEKDVFRAFNLCPLQSIKVVIIGQDPYYNGSACGLAFSVSANARGINPSLANIFKEITSDTGDCKNRTNGDLAGWASQGVFLLNCTLTVKKGEPNSHKEFGWDIFTKSVIMSINNHTKGVVFLLWGSFAHEKEIFVSKTKHKVLKAAHPSPLSRGGKFFGCKHFSAANAYLISQKKSPINWNL